VVVDVGLPRLHKPLPRNPRLGGPRSARPAQVGVTRGRRAQLGIAVFAVIALLIWLVFRSFNGDFGNNVTVTASIAQVSDSLDRGDIVTYRDVIVGEVRSYTANGRGGAELRLRLHASAAKVVPSNVSAVAVPASLFGNTQILLMPAQHDASTSLRNGAHVGADTSPAAAGLQTALADAYDLITAVHPAQLDAALTSLATALQGEGPTLGTLVDTSARYLRALAPAIPQLDAVISRFATATTELARTSPQLLGAVANLLTPALALTAQRSAVQQLLDVAPGVLAGATDLLRRTGDDFVTVVIDEQPLLRVLALDPHALPAAISGFKSLADALNSTFHNGHPTINVIISGINSAGLVPVLLGQKTDVVDKLVDPPMYSAAQCPRYPGASGPNCASAAAPSSSSAVVLSADATGNLSSVGQPTEVAAVRAILSAATGLPAAQVPESMDLLLGPMLRGTTTVVAR
jgi:phospholipid/cholesterol/gamma-HCH transport system substrate-binding protein